VSGITATRDELMKARARVEALRKARPDWDNLDVCAAMLREDFDFSHAARACEDWRFDEQARG